MNDTTHTDLVQQGLTAARVGDMADAPPPANQGYPTAAVQYRRVVGISRRS